MVLITGGLTAFKGSTGGRSARVAVKAGSLEGRIASQSGAHGVDVVVRKEPSSMSIVQNSLLTLLTGPQLLQAVSRAVGTED